jgi:peptidoglycan/LPS O-acetylase OafA/YrhL
MASKAGNEKYPPLTGVRALGASVVFFDHFPFQPDAHITLNVMAFFFALSGFLIVRIYYEQAQINRQWLGKYFLNRFARIYPVYFVLLTLVVFLQHATGTWTLLKNYTLLHALFHKTPLLIQASWTLTVEECFYFLAPAFMLLARRTLFAPLAVACAMSLAALGISRLDIGFLATPNFVLSTTFFGHFAEFFAGFYLALAVIKLEKSAPVQLPGARFTLAGLLGVSVLIAAMVLVYRSPKPDFHWIILINNFLIPFPIMLLYWGLIRESTVVSRVLASPLAGLLGRSSYSFYLLHALVIEYFAIPFLVPLIGNRVLYVLLTFIITWVVSIILFVSFEEPVNLFLRRKFRSKESSVGLTATLFQPRA